MEKQMVLQRSLTANEVVQILASWSRRDLGVEEVGRYAVTVAFRLADGPDFKGADIIIEKVAVETGVSE